MDSELVKYFVEKIEKLHNEKCELQAAVRHQATLLEITARKLEEDAAETKDAETTTEEAAEEPEIIEDSPSIPGAVKEWGGLFSSVPERKTITIKKN